MAGVSDSDSEEADTPRGKGGGLSYSQEQEELKSSFKAAAAVWEEGGAVQETLLIPRVKTKEEKVGPCCDHTHDHTHVTPTRPERNTTMCNG